MKYLEKLKKDDKLIFYIASIYVTFVFLFLKLALDDIDLNYIPNGTIVDYWNTTVEWYQTHASRTLINFVIFIFVNEGRHHIWPIFMGLVFYLMLYSISELVNSSHKKEVNLLITALVMIYPLEDLNSAGWVTTLTTYFWPLAFALFSFISVKKIACDEQVKWWEYVLYSAALIFGADHEQTMALAMAVFFVALVYFICTKRQIWFTLIQLIICIIRAIYALYCPGNEVRGAEDLANYLPNFYCFNIIDRLDMGFSSTMQYIFFGSNIHLIAVCMLIAYLVWKKTDDKLIRITSILPSLFMWMFGPFRAQTIALYPRFADLTDDISVFGISIQENVGDFLVFGKFTFWAVMLIILMVDIIILTTNLKSLLFAVTFIGAGVISRVLIGFAPSIVASGNRTCTVMAFSILTVGALLYSKNRDLEIVDGADHEKMSYILWVIIIIEMFNLLISVSSN